MTADPGLVAVTGAGGFLGTAVTRRLAAAGVPLRLLVGPPGTPVAALPTGVEARHGLIDDPAVLSALLADAQVVVHLAGPPSVPASYRQPTEYARSHVVGTATLLEALAGSGVRRLVHVSSAEVYGRPETDPVAESHPTRPISPYGVVKLAAESLAAMLAGEVELVVLRPFSVYGAGSPATSLVGRLLEQARTGEALAVADLRPVRDYVHVDDVAGAVRAALGGAPGTYNIAGGIGLSVLEVAEQVAAISGLELRRDRAPADRPVDIPRLVADIGAAAAGLGWTPSIALHDGLSAALASRG